MLNIFETFLQNNIILVYSDSILIKKFHASYSFYLKLSHLATTVIKPMSIFPSPQPWRAVERFKRPVLLSENWRQLTPPKLHPETGNLSSYNLCFHFEDYLIHFSIPLLPCLSWINLFPLHFISPSLPFSLLSFLTQS